MVESLQRVPAALLQDVVKVEDEHHDHALLVLHRDDVCDAQEVRALGEEVTRGFGFSTQLHRL